MGDSITAGAGTSDPATQAYPALLGHSLGRDYQVENFGVGGATVINSGAVGYQRQDAYSQALGFKPAILIVALGTNDREQTFDSLTQTRFQRDYKTLIAAFKKANPAVRVYTCLPTPAFPLQWSINLSLRKNVFPLIRQVARDTRSQVIDLNTPLSEHPELFPDDVHPNARGEQVVAVQVYRALTGK